MTRRVTLDLDGRLIEAFAGDRVLDALLLSGVELPGNCRTGPCRLCPLTVVISRLDEPNVEGRPGHAAQHVCACRTRIETDMRLSLNSAPVSPAQAVAAFKCDATVANIADLTPDVTEITLTLREPFRWEPGQYAHVTFEGFPARAFSLTVALDGRDRPNTIRLHVLRLARGVVSSALGQSIRQGHRVALTGPFGTATLTRGGSNRLMLFSAGTGFAPLWAIADAALRENANRPIVVVAGARALENLYMAEALERLSGCRGVHIVPVTQEPQDMTPIIRHGMPTDFAPMISAGDTVHAAGPAELVQALGVWSTRAGAQFHADPFMPSETSDDLWLAHVARRFAARPIAMPPAAFPSPSFAVVQGRSKR